MDIQAIAEELHQMMRVGEAAKYMGVSTKTLRNWDQSGRLPAKRNPMTRYRYYCKEDLDELIDRTLQTRRDTTA